MTSEQVFSTVDNFLIVDCFYKIEFYTGYSKNNRLLKYLGKVGEGKLFQFATIAGGRKITLSAAQLINRVKLPSEEDQKRLLALEKIL